MRISAWQGLILGSVLAASGCSTEPSVTAGTVDAGAIDAQSGFDADVDEVTWTVTGQANVDEGAAATYTVSIIGLSLSAGESVTVEVSTADGSTAPATAGDDYTALNSVTLTIEGPARSVDFSVDTLADQLLDSGETFAVQLANPSVGVVDPTDGRFETTISDLTSPQWSISGASTVNEGASATYTVSVAGLTLTAGQEVSILLDSGDSGATVATEGTDYTSADGTTVTITGPATTAMVSVATASDTVLEPGESFQLTLSSPSIGTISSGGDTVSTQILDATAGAEWSIAGDQNVNEGNVAAYTVSLGGGVTVAPGHIVSVDIATVDGTPPAATEGVDYDTADGSTIALVGPATSAPLNIQTNSDALVESNENFRVTLQNPSVGSVSGSNGGVQTTINDATVIGVWSITGDVLVNEGELANYTVMLNGLNLSAGESATVEVETLDGDLNSATEGVDYISIDGTTITITGPANSASFQIMIETDMILESTETFVVRLLNPSVGSISGAAGALTTSIVGGSVDD